MLSTNGVSLRSAVGVDFWVTQGNTLYLSVADGSYSIRILATPRQVRNDTLRFGAGRVAYFPVCTDGTGGGQEPMRVAKKDPGSETDAVAGC